MGTISLLNTPAACAAAQRCWLMAAHLSADSLVTPNLDARFSAVVDMVQFTCKSVRPSHRESTRFRLTLSGEPQRVLCSVYGALDMLSAPPVSTISDSPIRIDVAPCTRASNPDPHRRFTVSAGRSWGTPALSATWRAMYEQSVVVCDTLPQNTESIFSQVEGPSASSAPLAATAPR
jgi:hypothetical protein